MADKKVIIAKIEIKEKSKGKAWKNLSSADKDEILYELAKKVGLIAPDTVYK